MTTSPAIAVKGASVVYRPYIDRKPTLRKTIGKRRHKATARLVALDDVSVTINKGESFGVIGPNGAGKSTLLKLMGKTLKPDSGTVNVYGKTSTLLQLGLGMNPELSGRRNVYLGGLAAGMRKSEIDRKMESILDFADIGDAINRPVNTYSSGMFARLAFSVGMAIEPDIMLLDEVLAVGDEAFRAKSMKTMTDLVENAGTIVFVSHALESVESFCDRAMWLGDGSVKAIGDTTDVVAAYRRSVSANDQG